MGEMPAYEEITYGELRVGDVILPWAPEDVVINGDWRVTLLGPVPQRPELVEYQDNRNPYWRKVRRDEPVKIRKRLTDDELVDVIAPPVP